MYKHRAVYYCLEGFQFDESDRASTPVAVCGVNGSWNVAGSDGAKFCEMFERIKFPYVEIFTETFILNVSRHLDNGYDVSRSKLRCAFVYFIL